MKTLRRFSPNVLPISAAPPRPLPSPAFLHKCPSLTANSVSSAIRSRAPPPRAAPQPAAAGWLSVFLPKTPPPLPDIVKAGDPVLHEPADEVPADEIKSERIQNIIDDMVGAMRSAPGVGLAAPQIGVPLKIIVLEDTKEYIDYVPKDDIEAQDRRPFDLLVIVNPKLKKKSERTALFFEGCLSSEISREQERISRSLFEDISSYFRLFNDHGPLFEICSYLYTPSTPLLPHHTIHLEEEFCVDGFRAVVERHLEVEVMGLDRDGQPIKVDATGWQARILQHECDHLDGTIYVDKIVPKTFRTVKNLTLPLPTGCTPLGAR